MQWKGSGAAPGGHFGSVLGVVFVSFWGVILTSFSSHVGRFFRSFFCSLFFFFFPLFLFSSIYIEERCGYNGAQCSSTPRGELGNSRIPLRKTAAAGGWEAAKAAVTVVHVVVGAAAATAASWAPLGPAAATYLGSSLRAGPAGIL